MRSTRRPHPSPRRHGAAPLLALGILLCAGPRLAAADLQVMTVGDSITAGFQYQPRLKTMLEGDGHTVTFVGSQGTGANRHEGFSGQGIYHFVGGIPLASGSSHYITTALDTAWPSVPAGAVPVVLVHIGVNDLGHGLGRSNLANAPQDSSGNCLAAQFFDQDANGSWIDPMGSLDGMAYGAWLKLRLDTMVDLILAHASQPRLVVAKILPIAKGNSAYQADNDNCCERIKEWNGYWAAKVASVTGAAAARIAIVDCYADAEPKRVYGAVPGVSFWGDATAQQSDWVHPNAAVDGGYTMMAAKFKAGIESLLASGAPTSAAGSLSWSVATATVAEGAQVTLTVTRSGGSAGAVGVGFATATGTAGPSDFTAASGTLAFADGETSRTVTVATTQDALVEGSENFTVTLSAPTGGAVLGAVASTTVTISDDDVAVTPVPAPAPAPAPSPGNGSVSRSTSGCGFGSSIALVVIGLAMAVRCTRLKS